ncbi:peptide deformylase [Desulfovibrio inopinatus]|uniref:peptide deformylase n=1 Tax=Desulfovibrio inopinatus TaxID=102109 RepID=UPI00040FAA11|nr:peptide deformylase [Desulfovibrio inopinatus]
MPRSLVKYPDPRLAEKCSAIEEVTPELRALAEEMAEIMYTNEGIGLAAPQVGESCRLVVIDLSGPEKREDLHVLVNPVIVEKEGETEFEEGCLSVTNYRSVVQRAEKVKVRATDLDGNLMEIDADGLLAICLQHELDHLDGVLFIDHISRLKRSLYDKKVKKWAKKKEQNTTSSND